MFYLGNDQHARQITICLRDETGDVIQKRQVSTEPDKIRAFLADLRDRTAAEGGYIAIVEVCGFNDWYLDLLREMGCREVILVQPITAQSYLKLRRPQRPAARTLSTNVASSATFWRSAPWSARRR